MTCSNEPCHLQEAPGQGQLYGRNSHVSSWSGFSVCTKDTVQPLVEYLHGNITLLATFSIARFRMFPESQTKKRALEQKFKFKIDFFFQTVRLSIYLMVLDTWDSS